jgi:WD40-like Beta Propeller Repeat
MPDTALPAHRGRSRRAAVVLAVGIVLASVPAAAQYFGKNKITYERFDWKVYAAPHFDVHYYPATEPFLEDIVSYAESAYLKISRDLDHELTFRVPLITYKTHGEFQQTNVTLGEVPDYVGAFAEPVQYRMVLPIDLPPDKLAQLIAHELTHIFEFSYFFEGYLGRALRAQAPGWLMEGLASYLGRDEDNIDRMVMRDAVVNNVVRPIESLGATDFLTYRYGHAVFDYIEQEHGIEGLRTFLFEFKKVVLTGNLPKAIKESFGYEIDEFDRRFIRYLRRKYVPVLLEKKSPDDYGPALAEPKLRRVPSFSPTLSPSGELVAVLAVPKMEIDLLVLSAEGGKQIRNVTKGWTNDYGQLVAEAFSGKRDLSWSPVADHVAVFVRRENKWPLRVFDALSGKTLHDIVFDDIVGCASPAFSPDGRRVAFEGNRNGVVDLFEVDLDTRAVRNLTQDDFFDANPWYSADGKTLLYNRRIGSYWKLFTVDLTDPAKKTQLSFGPSTDIQPSFSRDGNTVYFSSDRNEYGVFNLYALDLTTGATRQYTDVVGGCFTPVEMIGGDGQPALVYGAFYEGTFRLYRMPLRSPERTIEVAESQEATTEAEPYEPPIRLTTDESKKERYKSRWDIDAPSIGVGVTDDGTFLGNVDVRFSDLLGDQRAIVSAATVEQYQSYYGTYINLRRRWDWGATIYQVSDFFYDQSSGGRGQRRYKATGGNLFAQYPFSRYYRFEIETGVVDSSLNQLAGSDPFGQPIFVQTDDLSAFVSTGIVGDTTRYQQFGPFQGKRFEFAVRFAPSISGDFDGNLLEYRADFRAYKQLTRRSTLAWRLGTLWNTGDRQNTYGFGGVNQLRGYDYRDFSGSRIVWSNLELRFPLIDELRFPIFPLGGIRGFFFLDVGAAWFDEKAVGTGFLGNDPWYDPLFGVIRADYSQATPVLIPFDFWDSENGQLQDGRGSYGVGFQFFFLGGLQFNWIWAWRMDHTQYVYAIAPSGFIDTSQPPVPVTLDTGGVVSDFYIQFDW